MKKFSTEEIRQILKSEGFILTSEYIDCRIKFQYVCPNGHQHESSWGNWKKGNRCPICSNKKQHTVEFVKSQFEKEGYQLLTKAYKNGSQLLEYICPERHHHQISWDSWKQGHRCKKCSDYRLSKSRSHDYSFIKEQIEKDGYELLSTIYEHELTPLTVVCPKGHTSIVKWKYFQTGRRCAKCSCYSSKAEREIKEYLKELDSNLQIDEHNREILKPYELDIYLPSFKLAIEHHGIYWHSSARETNIKAHQQKFLNAQSKGIRLIQIFEDEWIYKKDIVKSRLRHALNLSTNRMGARECDVREITIKAANEFCEMFHIQGWGRGANKAVGLFLTNDDGKYELCSVMTFGNPNLAKGGKNKKFTELVRFCSSRSIAGGAKRLFTFYCKKYNPSKIISYCDVRYGTGNTYKELGMRLVELTKPNYYYVKQDKRLHRFNFRKDILIKKFGADPSKTEQQITEELGINRVYDAGHYKFEYKR